MEQLEGKMAEAKAELDKFTDKGNKAAAKRCRGIIQDIKKLCQELRVAIQEKVKSEK